MSIIPFDSAEISFYWDFKEGIHIECSEKLANLIKGSIINAGLSCGEFCLEITGTNNIHNFVSFAVSDGTFNDLYSTVKKFLIENGVSINDDEEKFESTDGIHIRISLTNISIFDK